MAELAEDKGASAWYRVPTWDGSPASWRSFRREMNWWVSSLDLEGTAKYNLAARWLLRQSGIVKQRGEEFSPADLEYRKAEYLTDPQTGEEFLVQPADYLFGLNKLLDALEQINGQTTLDKRGELRTQFYLDLRRKPAERVSEYATRFRSLVADLKSEGVVLPSSELGWFFREKLGLDPLRKQLLDTALQGKEDYADIETETLRLFKDLHIADPLYRKLGDGGKSKFTIRKMFQSTAPSMSSASSTSSSLSRNTSLSNPSSYRRPSVASSVASGHSQSRRVMLTEVPEGEEEHVGEVLQAETEDDGETGQGSLEELIQSEAEVFAAELQEAEDYGVDPEILEGLESNLESAAETLVTMKEARSKLQEIRKDRGYGKPGNPAAKSQAASRKASGKFPCFDCNMPGHWAGDPECPKPGAGLGRKGGARPKVKQVRLAEALQSDHLPSSEPDSKIHEASMVVHFPVVPLGQALEDSLSRATHSTCIAGSKELAEDKLLVGALDSACNRTCTGPRWLEGYLKQLSETAPKWIVDLIQSIPERENFRFGNGSVVPSSKRWRLPGCIGGKVILIWISVVPIASLGCLLGRDFLDAMGAVLHFANRTLECTFLDTGPFRLRQMAAGHFMINLLPNEWPRLADGRWKKCGLDGIVELKMTPRRWFEYCSKEPSPEIEGVSHEHFLAESSISVGLCAGELHEACSVLSLARVMKSSSSSCVTRQLPLQGHGSAPDSQDFDSGSAAQPSRLHSGISALSLESSDVAFAGAQQLAFSRTLALVACTLGIALLAFSLSLSFFTSTMEASGRSYGESRCLAYVPLQEGCGIESIHSWKFEGACTVSQSFGPEVVFLGGSCVGRNVGSQSYERPRSFVEGHCCSGSSAIGQSSTQCCRKGDDGSDFAWASWWTSQTSPRFDQVGSAVECGLRRFSRQCGCVANQDQAYREIAHGQACDRSSDSWSLKFQPPRSGRSDCILPSSINTTSVNGRIHDVLVSSSFRSDKRGVNGRGAAVDGSAGSSLSRNVEPGVAAHDDTDRESIAASSADGRSDRHSGGRRPDVSESYRLLDGAKVKNGLKQMISQAWDRHRRDQLAVSVSAKQINDVFLSTWENEMKSFMNESFVTEIRFPDPFVTEIFTDTEPVAQATRRRGLNAGESLTLSTGWNFLDPGHCQLAERLTRKQKPYVLVLAFPCGPWSPLQNLNPARDLEQYRQEALQLVIFALKMAKIQVAGGRHFLMENPLPSAAWKLDVMQEFLESEEVLQVVIDMCAFDLRAPDGRLHREATRLVTSVRAVRVSRYSSCWSLYP